VAEVTVAVQTALSVAMLAVSSSRDYPFPMADPARTADPAEALEMAIRRREPVLVERGGHAVAAIVPIDLFEKWFGEREADEPSLIDKLLEISRSVPDDEWAKLPSDGGEHVDRTLLRQMTPSIEPAPMPHIRLDDAGVAWIEHTNVKVIEVVLDGLAHGWSPEEVHFQHPYLSMAQIHAALAWYYDHQVELDADIDRRLHDVEERMKRSTNSPLRRRIRGGILGPMSIKEEPHYTIDAGELATWLERQGADLWWSVDGDPLLMGDVSLPCPAPDLADAIRRINRPLLVLCDEPGANGETIVAADLDRVALKDNEGNRVLTMSWANGAREQEWVLLGDRDAARVGSSVLRRAAGS
jgi:uncharacterized protein (DUF433 family)